MNVDRHARIAKARGGGMSLLRAALDAAGAAGRDTQSLEVGNWLRDVSQVVDPVVLDANKVCAAVNRAESATRDAIDGALAVVEPDLVEALGTVTEGLDAVRRLAAQLDLIDLPEVPDADRVVRRLLDGVRGPLDGLVREVAEGARRAVNVLLIPPPVGRPALFEGAASVLRISGYIAHVHPERPGAEPRMDVDLYGAVFDEFFTQYWPHEHLDRPPEGDWFRSDTGATMYTYLDEHITILAGELALLDREWARPTFDRRATMSATEHAFHVARLARCLHKVEDFFAHSNFIDLLATRDAGLRRRLGASPYLSWLHALRLRRAVRGDDAGRAPIWPVRAARARRGPIEPLLVTGYFDSIDTLVSLAHVLESGFGFTPSDPGARAQAGIARVTQPRLLTREVVFELGELLHDPTTAFEDVDNKLAAHVKDAYGGLAEQLLSLHQDPRAWRAGLERRRTINERVLRVLLRDPDLVDGLPAQAAAWLADAFTWIANVVRVGRAAYGLFELLRDLAKLADLPAAIADAVLEAIPDFVSDRVRNAIAFHIQQVMYNAIGSARPGCHSLLAKDTDTSDPFADEALLLARVAHRAILHPLLDTRTRRALPAGRHVDWDTYVRLVLRNPLLAPRLPRWRRSAPRWWEIPLRRGQVFGPGGEVAPDVLHALPTVDDAQFEAIIGAYRTALTAAEAAYQPTGAARPCRAP